MGKVNLANIRMFPASLKQRLKVIIFLHKTLRRVNSKLSLTMWRIFYRFESAFSPHETLIEADQTMWWPSLRNDVLM